MRNNVQQAAQLFLRLTIGIAFFVYGTDRLGLWGPYGGENVAWGDWEHFMIRANKVMSFVPQALVEPFAVLATIGEIGLGALLIIGFKTRWAAIGCGILSLLFAVSMAISFGVLSPLGAGVFAACGGSFLLGTIDHYKFTLDALINHSNRKSNLS